MADTVTEEECSQVEETRCDTVYRQQCSQVEDQQCETVTEEQCQVSTRVLSCVTLLLLQTGKRRQSLFCIVSCALRCSSLLFESIK